MPMALQERAASLPAYKNVKAVRTKERILKKIPALVILAALFAVMIYASGARNFVQGFIIRFSNENDINCRKYP